MVMLSHAIVMTDYLYGKFSGCRPSFSSFGSIVRTNRHTDRQTRMNALLTRHEYDEVMLNVMTANVRSESTSDDVTETATN